MTLASIKNELHKARQCGYAVPLFDVFDQHGVDGIFEAQELERSPVIIGIYSGAPVMQNIDAFSAYIRARAERTCYPVAIMLDHGTSVDQCLYALESGFTDVMYDGSSLTFEENVRNTRRVVEAAHACGAAVEAELGHVGSGSNYGAFGGQRLGFTNPDLVAEFIDQTGVDFLAIAFGNAHGVYKSEPEIDLSLVSDIYGRVVIPLVMHGGSGLHDDLYRNIVNTGISKINFFTAIHNIVVERMIEAASSGKASMFFIAEQIRLGYRDTCSHFFKVISSSGRV
jgi:fructose-bisphosphate aldolase, class II